MRASAGDIPSPTCIIAGAGPHLGVWPWRNGTRAKALPCTCLRTTPFCWLLRSCIYNRAPSRSWQAAAILRTSPQLSAHSTRSKLMAASCDVLVYNAFVDDAELPVDVACALAFVQLVVPGNARQRCRGAFVLRVRSWKSRTAFVGGRLGRRARARRRARRYGDHRRHRTWPRGGAHPPRRRLLELILLGDVRARNASCILDAQIAHSAEADALRERKRRKIGKRSQQGAVKLRKLPCCRLRSLRTPLPRSLRET